MTGNLRGIHTSAVALPWRRPPLSSRVPSTGRADRASVGHRVLTRRATVAMLVLTTVALLGVSAALAMAVGCAGGVLFRILAKPFDVSPPSATLVIGTALVAALATMLWTHDAHVAWSLALMIGVIGALSQTGGVQRD